MATKKASSFHRGTLVVLIVCLAIPLVASGFVVQYLNRDIFYEQKSDNLYALAHVLDSELGAGGYDAIINEAGAENASREEKIQVLNDALRDATDRVASVSAGLGMGFYSRELDAIVTYGPSSEFQENVGKSIAEDHPGREVMATNTAMVSQGTMVRGDIMNAMIPVERGGEVIGYIWANELISDLENALNRSFGIITVLLVVAYLIMVGIVLVFFQRLIRVERRARESIEAAREEAENAREEALAATRAKSSFLASMSHEMRTPLNAVIGMTAIAENSQSLEQKDYCLGKIDEASKHLLGVINDILDISKIEADKFELSEGEFSFNQMVQMVAGVIGFRVDAKKQKLIVSVDENIPDVLYGDDQRLAQVLTNLLGNAVKFTPEEGTINLDARLQSRKGNRCTLKVSVRDNGIGIDAKKQSQLFQSFTQEDSSTVREYGGTGLGLAISKNIVEMMGGRIWVESEKGKGSDFIFTVELEVVQDTDESFGEKQAQVINMDDIVDRFKGYSLLLAEDVEINREIVLTLLEPTGLEIDCAENGLEAVEMFKKDPEKYAMIFMDIHMPEMDGYEATRQIRALPGDWSKEVPIVAMTANVFREDVERCLAAGMNDHVGKPLSLEDIVEKLEKYLS